MLREVIEKELTQQNSNQPPLVVALPKINKCLILRKKSDCKQSRGQTNLGKVYLNLRKVYILHDVGYVRIRDVRDFQTLKKLKNSKL